MYARDLTPTLLKLVKDVMDQFSKEDQQKQRQMMKHLKNWDGRFHAESISASVYSFMTLRLYESWWHHLLPGEEHSSNRLLLQDNYSFVDYVRRLFYSIAADESVEQSHLAEVCKISTYTGNRPCAHSLAVALA